MELSASSKKINREKNAVGIFKVVWILMNIILGSGILSIPKALQKSYFYLGLILLVIVCLMCDYVCTQLIRMAEKVEVNSFESLADATFGKWLYYAICIFCFLFTFGALVGYASAIHDSMQKLYTLYINKNPVEATWAPIGITIGLFMIFVVPFSYQKDMSSLSWLSMLSIATFGVIFVFVFAIGVKTPNTPSNYAPLDGTKFISAFGTLSFAFVCTDSIFPVYQNLKNRTPGRWDKVVHITMLSLGLLYASFAITCYFLIPFLGDYVLNSESITNLMETNIAKILLAITLLLTYLSNIHVSRTYIYAVIERAIKPLSEISNKNFKILHGCVTTMLIVVTILLGIYLNDLLFIVNMTGLISSTAVGFIIPTMIIFKVKTMKKVSGDFKNAFTGSLSFRKRLLYILHFLFPIFIFIFGLIGFAAGAPLEIINFVG